MADQNITALPIKTAPAEKDQVMLLDQAEGYLIDYEKLADAILNKLLTKKFQMDTGLGTLIQAVNILNGKFLVLTECVGKIQTPIDGFEYNLGDVTMNRSGNVVSLRFNINGKITKMKEFITLLTLPEKYIPTKNVFTNYISQDGTPMILSIEGATGIVQIYANSDRSEISGFVLRLNTTYIV